MTRLTHRFALLLALGVLPAACGGDDDDQGAAGETELITQVALTLSAPGQPSQTVSITDADGNGPNPPGAQVGTLELQRGVTYAGSITFTNTTTDPDTDITTEVAAEADEHRVFYTVSGTTGVTVTIDDEDGNGAPVGLLYSVTAAPAAPLAAGALRVVLSHYDDLPKGDGTTPSNETDVDVTFTFDVTAPAGEL